MTNFQSRGPGPEVIKKIFCPQLSIKFIMLINVKIPTIDDILTFISMINTTSKRLKAKNVFLFMLWAVEISCSVELSMKKVITSEPGLEVIKLFMLNSHEHDVSPGHNF